ncbi:DUF1275 domain-containing protein [bacterium]|nr:DUF1275 domain-containing protein [bacterium]
MQRDKNYKWIVLGGTILAINAGFINSVSFLGMYHQAVSHTTGNVTRLGIELANLNKQVLVLFFMLLSFLFGSIVSGLIISGNSLKLGRRYGIALMVEAFFLFLSIFFLNKQNVFGEYFASVACGLQNAMATTYTGAILRTTHVTGILTDIGVLIGHFLRKIKKETWKLKLYSCLFFGFLFGSFQGNFFFKIFSYNALLFPASICFLVGFFYFVWRHFFHFKKF